MQSHLLSVIIFLPLLGVPALLFLRGEDHTWIRRIALVISLVELAASCLLLSGFRMGEADYQFAESSGWIGDAIHYHIGVDGLSLFLVLLTTFLTPLAILCSWNSIHENVKGFFIAILVIETSMIGVFVSLDLFLFFVFWEMTLIPMYFMIGIWGHDRRIYAAVKFILYTMFGSILMLVAILWLYNLSGTHELIRTFDLPELQLRLQRGLIALPPHTELWLFGAFFLAFAIKVPLFPFHTWLPDAHSESPAPVSAMLSGALLNTSMLGIARFLAVVRGTSINQFAHSAVVGFGIFSFVIAALFIVRQTGIKRLMAYSSVEHIGVQALGLGFGGVLGVAGALYHMLNHSLNKSLMFFGAGNAMRVYGTKEISGIRHVLKTFPVSGTLWLLGAVGIAGAPPFALFLSEFTILRAGIGGRYRWAAVLFVVFLIIVFIGFLAHFRAMYFDAAPEA